MVGLGLRIATREDARILFDWANDPDVRRNSFNTGAISWEEHIAWLDGVLSDDKRLLYIFEVNSEPAGVIRLDLIADGRSDNYSSAEVSYSLDPVYRGKGYGKKMLAAIEEEIRSSGLGVDCLVARVKPGNVASEKTFLGAGYEEEFIEYRKDVGR